MTNYPFRDRRYLYQNRDTLYDRLHKLADFINLGFKLSRLRESQRSRQPNLVVVRVLFIKKGFGLSSLAKLIKTPLCAKN
jgi:predicted TIM-barrel fold metal-dependent hydrolase